MAFDAAGLRARGGRETLLEFHQFSALLGPRVKGGRRRASRTSRCFILRLIPANFLRRAVTRPGRDGKRDRPNPKVTATPRKRRLSWPPITIRAMHAPEVVTLAIERSMSPPPVVTTAIRPSAARTKNELEIAIPERVPKLQPAGDGGKQRVAAARIAVAGRIDRRQRQAGQQPKHAGNEVTQRRVFGRGPARSAHGDRAGAKGAQRDANRRAIENEGDRRTENQHDGRCRNVGDPAADRCGQPFGTGPAVIANTIDWPI